MNDPLESISLITAIAGVIITGFFAACAAQALFRNPEVVVRPEDDEEGQSNGANVTLDPEEIEIRRHTLFMALTIATAVFFCLTIVCLTIQYTVSVNAEVRKSVSIEALEATMKKSFEEMGKAIQEQQLVLKPGDAINRADGSLTPAPLQPDKLLDAQQDGTESGTKSQ